MKSTTRRVIAALCALVLVFVLVPCAAYADDTAARERPELEEVRVYICSLLSGRAYIKRDIAYIALTDIAAMYDISLTLNVSDTGFTASAPGLELSGEAGSGYVTANYRYLYLPHGYIEAGGDIYLPLDVLCRIFSLNGEYTDGRVEISTAKPRMIRGNEDYYETNFSADELYWLPHIAYVEALDEPLAGIMGVVSVVLNRVENEDFPDSIFEVLYDSRHTVQFTPAATGSMHGKPTELYYIATYLVLEGYNTVGESLYFVNPENNGNYWFRENLTFVVSIGDHEFYK